MINKEDRTCEKCENIYANYAFPFKNINLCLFCYEEDRHTRLHKFRSSLSYDELNKYRNKYFKRQEPVINSQKKSDLKTNKSTQSSKTPEEIVLEIVRNYPGLTGQEIAKKAFQNYLITYNILIEKLNGHCYKDENYGWHLLNQSDQTDEKIKEKNITRVNGQTNQEIITIAVKEHREATISYKGFSRTIHPYNVNSTYCVAYCTYRNDLRTFRLDRMKNIKLGEKFSVDSTYINKSHSQIENAKNFRKYY